MVRNGSTLKALSDSLTAAQKSFYKREKSLETYEYTSFLQKAKKHISEAIKNKDCDMILQFEKRFQNFDKIYANNEKEINAIEAIYKVQKDIEKVWNEGKNQELVRNSYADLFKGKKLESLTQKQREDTGMGKLLNAKRRYLTKFALGTSNAAENEFFTARKTALYFLQTAHQKNIDRALGYDMSKDKGLSR